MNDPKILKKVIEERAKRYIEPDDDIGKELLELLITTNSTTFTTLFKTNDTRIDKSHRHKIYTKCADCGSESITEPLIFEKTKAYIMEVKQKGFSRRCPKCEGIYLQKKEIEEQQYIQKQKEKQNQHIENVKKNTKYYIQQYLTSGNTWKDNVKQNDRWDLINQSDYVIDLTKIKNHILSIDYYAFLNTPYWKAVSQHILYTNRYTCQICDTKTNLITHHKTYKNHGLEHIYWKTDLMCICMECHRKLHEKEKEV